MKTTFIILGSLLAIGSAAQVSGPNTALSYNTSPISGSSTTWTNLSNVNGSDDIYTNFGNIPGGAGNYTDYLVIKNFNLSVPAGTNINGIRVQVERSDPNGLTSDYSVRIVKSGIIGASEKSTGQAYPYSDAIQTYGGTSDLWGETWTYKEVSNEDFGIAIATQRNSAFGTTAGRIDNVTITVYYSFITLPVHLSSFKISKQDKSALLSWTATDEFSLTQYVIERSANGIDFRTVGSVTANNSSVSGYTFKDENPLAGNSYYRLRIENCGGLEKYSAVVPVNFGKYTSLSLSPSPWTKGSSLYISNPLNEELTISFFTIGGKLAANVRTKSTKIDMPELAERGLVYFKVQDKLNQPRGSGTLVIY